MSNSTVADISSNFATSGVVVTANGEAAMSAERACWSKTLDGTGSGSFTNQINSLVQGTTSYLIAYPTNSIGTAFSDLTTFTTLGPTLKLIYGALYNGFSVIDSRSIAPEEWHVPTDNEWTILTDK